MMQYIHNSILKKHLRKYLKRNIKGYFQTYALSIDDTPYQPNKRLYDLCCRAIRIALNEDLIEIANRFDDETAKYIITFPGEHYRLLASIVRTLDPRLIIEIGTYTGASSLVMKKYLAKNSKIITYDIFPWDTIENTGFIKSDFNGQLEQKILDLSLLKNYEREIEIIRHADLIFLDAAKDGKMEQIICNFLDMTKFDSPPIIIFDDIKFISMIKVWREIKHPKIDITSFGHWSGTGIIDWS